MFQFLCVSGMLMLFLLSSSKLDWDTTAQRKFIPTSQTGTPRLSLHSSRKPDPDTNV